MSCYHPLQGYRSRSVNASGKRFIVFNPKEGFIDLPVTVPCGQCIGCRLERSRQWAIRCCHEASLFRDNCFITLTYSNKFLPSDMSLDKSHFQKFMKRLRKRFIGTDKVIDEDGSESYPIRFFHCGEYGDLFRRPHYHALLFNFDFPDKKFWSNSKDQPLFRSEILEELWPFGHSSVGSATFESAAYVARYIMKKKFGDDSIDHYLGEINPSSGEVYKLTPEYTTMSRRPGIGSRWFDSFSDDVYKRDEVVLRNRKMRPPKYYDSLFEFKDPDAMARLRVARKLAASKFSDDNNMYRRDVKERVKLRQIESLTRLLDKEL